ncbi:putative cobalt transport protein [Acinetobacter phage vB_AbaM-IME-AB2]|uniref:Putative cobalt transport protein n=1 Tax=Acinetobacter phage vB_AbaM-IME-AB2 TaxID=1243183 RepID=K4P041_9CAUD|nr:putative cobalt transport protein [Acinetobacter phage vB_AbaM-IME-AB2]AFV51490.1 putative cobalt transport protein [Acinetobacter phage vB_AbaM-IME-AB2]
MNLKEIICSVSKIEYMVHVNFKNKMVVTAFVDSRLYTLCYDTKF